MTNVEVPSWAEFQQELDKQIESGAVNGAGNLVLTQRDGTQVNAGAVRAGRQDLGSIRVQGTPTIIAGGSSSYLWSSVTGWSNGSIVYRNPGDDSIFKMVDNGIQLYTTGVYEIKLALRQPGSGYPSPYFGLRLRNGYWYYDWTTTIVPVSPAALVPNIAQLSIILRNTSNDGGIIGMDALLLQTAASGAQAGWGAAMTVTKISEL